MIGILRKYPALLLFGILQIFFSAPGQTFLISLFVAPVFRDIGVSMVHFAAMYSAATVLASFLLVPAGKLIDRTPVHRMVIIITGLMAGGCVLLAAARNAATVFAAFFLLRLIGQGVYGLTASTLMIKKFHRNRGSALGVITLGFPFSEAVYPVLALALLETVGWRDSYVIFGISNLALMLPVQLFLLKKSRLKRGHFLPGEELINPQRLPGQPSHLTPSARSWTVRETLRDARFYLLLFASCVPPLVITGLLFHQNTLFEQNFWSIGLAAGGFMVYAFCKAVGSVAMGPIVDRSGPLLPFVILIVLLGAGAILPALLQERWVVYLYFALIGAALGFSSPVMNVVWPHFYGIGHIGQIKGVIAMFRNGLTGLGPLPIALALDAGWTMNDVLLVMGSGVFLIALLPVTVWRMPGPRHG